MSATVTGGMGGRLLGGFVFPAEHWRLAFVGAAAIVAGPVAAAVRWLPRDQPPPGRKTESTGFLRLLSRPELLRMLSVGFFAFFVFSAMFNYVPFYLSGPPLHASVRGGEAHVSRVNPWKIVEQPFCTPGGRKSIVGDHDGRRRTVEPACLVEEPAGAIGLQAA